MTPLCNWFWYLRWKSYGDSNSAPDYIYGVKMCIICDILSRNRPHKIISVPWSDPRERCDHDRHDWIWVDRLLRLRSTPSYFSSSYCALFFLLQCSHWFYGRVLIDKYWLKGNYRKLQHHLDDVSGYGYGKQNQIEPICFKEHLDQM